LDPYEFRKRNISHPRWLGVLKAAADAAKWTPRVAASNVSGDRVVAGRGMGLGTHHLQMNQGDRITFAAAVVDIEVNKDNGVVIAKHIYGAMDCGLAVNPGIVESQIVGMSVHGTSLALKEEVQFNQTNVTSLDWNTYQTLRFGEHPAVTPIVVQQINERSSGAGEEVLPAVVAAIGNAFFDATGVRLRQFPLTAPRVLAALKSAANGRPA
jgi:CO/xanthine dehydrogenase Mo-binding subunit